MAQHIHYVNNTIGSLFQQLGVLKFSQINPNVMHIQNIEK